jgi:hypothetical protein
MGPTLQNRGRFEGNHHHHQVIEHGSAIDYVVDERHNLLKKYGVSRQQLKNKCQNFAICTIQASIRCNA